LIETRTRPSVQEDGGDIAYKGFDFSTGVVQVELQETFLGCSTIAVTLQLGIDNMFVHSMPEFKKVLEWKDEALKSVCLDQLSNFQQEFEKTTDKSHRNKGSKAAKSDVAAEAE
jgi:NFU1 iron-sulfur cluster scaffold homolog, mitochondrial